MTTSLHSAYNTAPENRPPNPIASTRDHRGPSSPQPYKTPLWTLRAPLCCHLSLSTPLTSSGTRRRSVEEKPPLGSSWSSGRSSTARVEVAVGSADLPALSLVPELASLASISPCTSCLAGIRSRHRRHHLPERNPATSASLRAPHALHASQNPRGTLLSTSAADPQPSRTPAASVSPWLLSPTPLGFARGHAEPRVDDDPWPSIGV
jgi:hypothetical protein